MCRLWAARLTGPLLALLLVAAAMGRAEGAAPAPALAPESDCLLPPSAADDGDAGGVELGMEPLFSFGLIADAQHSDKPDGTDDLPRVQRYRLAPAKLAAALQEFRNATPPLAFVLHLGDLIEGNKGGWALTGSELERMAAIFDEELEGEVPAFHLLGNHDAAAPRDTYLTRLRFPAANESRGYYSEALPGGWRLLGLDTNELSLHSGFDNGSAVAREAQDYWAARPKSAAEPQMSSWNGGITREQLAWLQRELAAAEAAGEQVIVASHNPLTPGAGPDDHLAWNWRDIEAALLASPALALSLNGHYHPGGFTCRGGRGWVGVQAILEAPVDGNAYALVHVYPDRVVIDGRGTDIPSRSLAVPPA